MFSGGDLMGGIFQVGIFPGIIFLEPQGISFKENKKQITKFFKAFKKCKLQNENFKTC